MLVKLTRKIEQYDKNSFWASDFGKPLIEIYWNWKKEPYTNPPQWYDTLKWSAGKGVEEAMLQVLKDSDVVAEDYDQKEHGRIEMERNGIKVSGYCDALTKEGIPIEIKSINNANKFDIAKYEKGEPRENYVGQLAIYMDALGKDLGHLFVSSIDGLNRFWFECKRLDGRKFKCGNVEVDLDEQYKKWSKLKLEHIDKDIVPDVFEIRYKYPIEEIEWGQVSKTDIGKARNGHKVLGDWNVSYSNWKHKLIELQGETEGYTPDELTRIKELTKGFTTWS